MKKAFVFPLTLIAMIATAFSAAKEDKVKELDFGKLMAGEETKLLSSQINGQERTYSFSTNESFKVLQERFLKATSEGWVVADAEKLKKEAARGHAGRNPLGEGQKPNNDLAGEVMLTHPDKPSLTASMAVFKTPHVGKKFSMLIAIMKRNEAPRAR